MKNSKLIWLVKIIVVVILFQTLFFKFTGAKESVYIFSSLKAEPYGRIGSGIIELVASILILIPRTSFLGTLLAMVTMIGAIFSHIFILGIEIMNDGGTLFALALITFVLSIYLLVNQKNKLLDLLKLKFGI